MSKNARTGYDPNWQEKYSSMLASPTEAVARVRPGQRVFVGTGCGEPQELVQRVTGSRINSDAYVRYLKQKYGDIYGL